MGKIVHIKKVKSIFTGAAAVLYAVFLVVYVRDITAATANSVRVCLEVIIPSLYAFMVISGFIVSSGLYAVLGRPFGWISRYIFRVPEEYFAVFLIGSVGGYPVGARLLADMCRNGKADADTAEHMLQYCYLAGPAFICGIAGVGLFSSIKIGMVIFSSIIGANFIFAALSGLGRKIPPKGRTAAKLDLSADCLIGSVCSGAEGMISICAIIVFFSSVICILDKLNVIAAAASLVSKMSGLRYADSIAAVKAFLEISNISSLTKGDRSLIPLAAALLSFGGVCVTVQTAGFVRGVLSTKRFYLSRIILMITSYFLCKMLIAAMNIDSVCVIAPDTAAHRQNPPISAIFLLIMTILLLSNISIEKNKKM